MQTIQHMPGQAPDSSKPYCLMNSDGSVADWFATHADAVAAMRSTTTASRRFNEDESFGFSLTPVAGFQFGDGDGVWIEALQAKDYHTERYGVVPVTATKLQNLVTSVKKNVRGIQLSTDYDHGNDVAKGNKASGTIKDAKVDGNTLFLNVAFTDTAKDEIKKGEWKYFSSDWLDSYVHDDGSKHTDVLVGGGLTNRPIAKGLNPLPINFSEFYTENAPQASEDTNMNPVLKRLAESFGIQFSETDDEKELEAKVFAEMKKVQDEHKQLSEEVKPLRELKATTESQKSFAEVYPEQAAQMEADRKFRVEHASTTFASGIGSKRFSESLGKKDSDGHDVVVSTSKGLSALALDKVKETHLKFSEGTVTVGDFADTINTIIDGGIVDYGESGTSTGTPGTAASEDAVAGGTTLDVRMAFAEKVTEIEAEVEGRTFAEALPLAAKKYPKMYEAYLGARSVA